MDTGYDSFIAGDGGGKEVLSSRRQWKQSKRSASDQEFAEHATRLAIGPPTSLSRKTLGKIGAIVAAYLYNCGLGNVMLESRSLRFPLQNDSAVSHGQVHPWCVFGYIDKF